MGTRSVHARPSSKSTGGKVEKAGAHVSIASLCLPPGVSSEVKGELVVCVDGLRWKYRQPPQQVQLRISWWGAPATADTVVPFHSSRGAGAAFPLTSGPRFLVRYLRDLSVLTVGLEECPSGRTIGTISIETSQVDVTRPLLAQVPCLGASKQVLATADVSLRIQYNQLLSSFEMAEHLASADRALPLYPLPVLANHSSAAADGADTAQAAPASTTVVTDAVTFTAPAGGDVAQREPTAAPTQHQDQHKAAQHGVRDLSAAQPLSAAASKQDIPRQKQPDAAAQLASAAAVVPSSSTELQPPPLSAPVWDIIRKAEQLKAALDQATQTGALLTLAPMQDQQQQCSRDLHPLLLPATQSTASLLPLLASPVSSLPMPHQQFHPYLPLMNLAVDEPDTAQVPAVPLLLGHASSAAAAAAPSIRHDLLPAADPHQPQHARHSSHAAASDCDMAESPVIPLSPRSISSTSSAASSLMEELDDLEELEVLLMQELLNMRTPAVARRSAARKASSMSSDNVANPTAATGATGPAATDEHQQLHPPSGQSRSPGQEEAGGPRPRQLQLEGTAQLQVEVLSCSGLAGPSGCVTAVLKWAGQQHSLDLTALAAAEGQAQQQAAAGQAATGAVREGQAVSAVLPACLTQPSVLAGPCLVMEVWSEHSSTSPPAGTSTSVAQLLGIVRVPLQRALCLHQEATDSPADAQCSHLDVARSITGTQVVLVQDTYQVYDVLHGRDVAAVSLRVLLLPAAGPTQAHATEASTDGPGNKPACSMSPETGAAAVTSAPVAVRHIIDITLVSASGLPSRDGLSGALQDAPEQRFVKYCFPGDEPLYTQEVDCTAGSVFAAHARHTVVLQPHEALADCFGSDEPGAEENLTFEVYDKLSDDTVSLAASGSFLLQQVLELLKPGISTGSRHDIDLLVPLTCVPAAPAQPQADPGSASLQVCVSYSREDCDSLDEPPQVPDSEQQALSMDETMQQPAETQQQQQGENDPVARSPSHEQHLHHQVNITQHRLPATDDAPAAPARAAAAPRNLNTGDAVDAGAALCVQQQTILLEEQADIQQEQQRTGPGTHDAPPVPLPAITAAAAHTPPATAAVNALLCVKVVRACGLQAAVKEAEHWLGKSSGLLGRSHQLGPHPYITLSLFPGSPRAVTIKTPFQAQTFCPQFHFQEVVPLCLDAPTLTALATTDANLELWHHCPRSQAVVAALSRGLSSSHAMTGQQQVFLGSAAVPLQRLLTHPQGLRSWVVVRSQLGAAVGAVQVHLSLSHIQGVPAEVGPAALAPLARHPEWLQLLPAAPALKLSGLAVLPCPGFDGQWLRCSLHLEELLLPGGDEAALERPKIATYMACFKLPGSSQECCTPAKACSSHAAGSNLLARSWQVDWKWCTHHWALADGRLTQALLAYPLMVTVLKQEPGKLQQSSRQAQGLMVQGKGQHGAAAAAAAVPIGTVEVDASPLLATRLGSSAPSCRWLSGTYAVIHPMSKDLGSTRLRLKLVLDLSPPGTPEQTWLDTHPDAVWSVSAPIAAAAAAGTRAVAVLPSTAAASSQVLSAAAAAAHEQLVVEAASLDEVQQVHSNLHEVAGPALQLQLPVSDAPAAERSPHTRAGDQHQQQALPSTAHPGALQGFLGSGQVDRHAAGQVSPPPSPSSPPHRHTQAPQPLPAATSAPPRRRGEVSHVSAPAAQPCALDSSHTDPTSPAPSEPAAIHHTDTAVGPYGSYAVSSPSTSRQDGLSLVLVQPAGSPVQQQAPLHGGLLPTSGTSVCDVRVCVESALNLELPEFGEGWVPALYVAYSWPDCPALVTTPLVTPSRGPLGGHSGAKWFHCLHLPLVLHHHQQQQQQQAPAPPDPRGCSTPSSLSGPVMVLFQVWSRAVPQPEAAALPPLYTGVAAAPCASDVLLGCAALDLSALQLLGTLDGWYNITDLQQQPVGQLKVSLTPARPLPAAPRPRPSAVGSLPDMLAAAWSGHAAQLSAPASAALLESSLEQMQQQLEQLHGPRVQQLHDRLGRHAEDHPDLLHELPDGHIAEERTNPGQLSDEAFIALATQSTAAAEATAAAAEAVANTGAQAVQSSDLLSTLKANLEELDRLQAALVARIDRSQQHTPLNSDQIHLEMPLEIPSAPLSESKASDLAGNYTCAVPCIGAEQPPAARNCDNLRHVQTLSDDEDYLVAPVGASDSEEDTEELMGRVDWSLAANSDGEHDAPAGPPAPSKQPPTSFNQRPAPTLQQPLNTEEWMFDISKPCSSNSTAAAVHQSGSSSDSRPGPAAPVHPGQVSSGEARAAGAAAAARLAQVDAAAAAAAARRAAAAAAAAAKHPSVSGALTPPSDHTAAATACSGLAARGDMWDRLAEVEQEDEAQGLRKQQQRRQQRDQHFAGILSSTLPSDSQQQQHDPRKLPDDLELRLDALLAEFKLGASGAGALVGRDAAGPLPQFRGYTEQASAAAAFGHLDGGGAHRQGSSRGVGPTLGSDDGEDEIPIQRVTHATRSGAQPSGSSGSGTAAGADVDEMLPTRRVSFANALPPVQEDFQLQYSDGPRSLQPTASCKLQQPSVQQQPGATTSSSSSSRSNPEARVPGNSAREPSSSSSRCQGLSGVDCVAAAVDAAVAPCHQQPGGPVLQAAAASPPHTTGFVMSTVGRRPVGGGGGPAASFDMDDAMFGFSRRPSGGTAASSSSASGISARHPCM